jgi:uncharacterized membrane-anchored protein
MNHKTWIAVGVQVAAMIWILVPPALLARTGTTAYLETEKMDPRALFRGDYVILGYRQAQGIVPAEMAQQARRERRPVYVTFTTDRPGRFVAVSLERPEPAAGQVCIAGRPRTPVRPRPRIAGQQAPETTPEPVAVDFPAIAQYFVPEGEGRALEAQRGEDLLARVAVNDRCQAVLLGLEPR